MPILNYKCTQCGKEFAKILMSLENAPKNCPVCDAEDLVEVAVFAVVPCIGNAMRLLALLVLEVVD